MLLEPGTTHPSVPIVGWILLAGCPGLLGPLNTPFRGQVFWFFLGGELLLDGFWIHSGRLNASLLIVTQMQRRTRGRQPPPCWGPHNGAGHLGGARAGSPFLQLLSSSQVSSSANRDTLFAAPCPGGSPCFAEGQGGDRQHSTGAEALLWEKGGADLVSGFLGVLVKAKGMQPRDQHKEAISHTPVVQRGRAWLGRQQCSW